LVERVVLLAGIQLWRLTAGADKNLGLGCTEEGLYPAARR
jgi:hypothetical protein